MKLKNFTPAPLSEADTPTADCVLIYADGACKGNPGPGGWAATIRVYADGKLTRSAAYVGGDDDTTNNRMEIIAVLEAIRKTAEGTERPVIVRTDSNVLVQSANQWLPGWIAKGWKKADGKPVANADLLQELAAVMATRKVIFEHVRGHARNAGNDEADKLASNEGAKRVKRLVA